MPWTDKAHFREEMRKMMSSKSDLVRDSLRLDRKIHYDDRVSTESTLGKHISEHINSLEIDILEHIAQGFWVKMTPAQRSSFERTLAQISAEHGQAPSKLMYGAGGALLLGNLGGFGTYMVVSSVLHTVGFGLLGFGAYTAVSSILAIALGPVGWTALAGYVVFKFGSPNMKKLIPIVVAIAMLRRKQMQ